jgi:hypothetical protein
MDIAGSADKKNVESTSRFFATLIKKKHHGDNRTDTDANVNDAENIDLDEQIDVLRAERENTMIVYCSSFDLVDHFGTFVFLFTEISPAFIVFRRLACRCAIRFFFCRFQNQIGNEISPNLS